jgi:flagellar biosynthesis protein FlhF
MTIRESHIQSSQGAVIVLDAAWRRASEQDRAGAQQREARTAQRTALLSALNAHRVPDALAHALADDAVKLGHTDPSRGLAAALDLRMRAKPIDYATANAILLKGINGAGKTSVAAKIAAQAFLTGRKVRILTAEPSAPRLSQLVSQLAVKVVAAKTVGAVASAVDRAYASGGLVVIDTSGFNPRNAKARAAFQALAQVGQVETIGVVSALYDAAEIGEIVAALNAQRLIVTGLDLSRRAGALTIAATQGPPLAHVARSAVPGDGLEPLTPLALAHTLLGIRPAKG